MDEETTGPPDERGPILGWLTRNYGTLTDGQRWTMSLVVILVIAFAAGGLRQTAAAGPDDLLAAAVQPVAPSAALVPDAGPPVTAPPAGITPAPFPLDTFPTDPGLQPSLEDPSLFEPTPTTEPEPEPTTTTTQPPLVTLPSLPVPVG
jgi:hypothetical protein